MVKTIFAREWRWYVGCVAAVALILLVFGHEPQPGPPRTAEVIVGLPLVGLMLYGAVAAVRITVWSFTENSKR